MRGPKKLFESEDHWVTAMGASFPGERVVVRGKDLFTQLFDQSWQGLLLYIILEKQLKANEIEFFDRAWALGISYPDPRVWNNRVAAFVGTTRGTAHLAVAASTAVVEARLYGGVPNITSLDFICRAKTELDQGKDLNAIVREELRAMRAISGYGRPVSSRDERIEPFKRLANELGMDKGEHLQIAYAVEDYLMTGKWRMQLNVLGFVAAIAADVGFTSRQFYHWLVNGYDIGSLSCWIDASQHGEGELFPLRCSRVNYAGKENRVWGG